MVVALLFLLGLGFALVFSLYRILSTIPWLPPAISHKDFEKDIIPVARLLSERGFYYEQILTILRLYT